MDSVSKKTIFHLLSSRQGDSFELGKEFFLLLPADEKAAMKRLLNDTSIHYSYHLDDGIIKRVETARVPGK